MSSPLDRSSDNPRQRHKADIRVDTVNTLSARQTVPAALLITCKEPRTKIRNQSLRGHAVPIPPDHELVLDTHANPTAPEEEPAYGSRQQEEGPPARALSPPPTHLNSPGGGQATAREPTRQTTRPQALSTRHSKIASDEGARRAQGGTRTGCLPLYIRHSPENIPNPAQSGTRTTEPGCAHCAHRFCEYFLSQDPSVATVPPDVENRTPPPAFTPPTVTTFPG